MLGQPVRGQKTRSNFRKGKGNVMGVKVAVVVAEFIEQRVEDGEVVSLFVRDQQPIAVKSLGHVVETPNGIEP